MKQKTLRIVSMLLCLIMLVSMIPIAASAEEANQTPGDATTSSSSSTTTTTTTVPKFTVTMVRDGFINNGQTVGSFAAGEKVTITASSIDPCTEFYMWSVDGMSASALLDSKDPQTCFIMPAGNVKIAAVFEEKHDLDENGACKTCKKGFYSVIEGDDAKWKKGGVSGLSFTANGDFKNFANVYVDKDKLTQDLHYTASSGSTVINLPFRYLNGLTDGEHLLTIEYTDGSCSASFTIQPAPPLTSKVVKSIVMEVPEAKPAAGKNLYYPELFTVNGRTDYEAYALLGEVSFDWYYSETYSTNSAAYQEYEKSTFDAGYAYDLYTNLSAAPGASFDEKCTFTLKTPSGTVSGFRYETRNDNTSFDTFFTVIADPSATTTTTTTTTSKTPDAATSVKRLYGDNRYSTAIDISSEGWSKADTVVIASGENYPDALAGTVLAKAKNAPILLVKKDGLDANVLAELQRLGAKNVIILGGEAAVSTAVADNLSKSFTVSRIGGINRNDTAAKIALEVTGKSSTVFLVSNNTFADALSAGAAAALSGAPILYVNADGTIPAETASALRTLGCTKAYVIGGEAAVGKKIESNLRAADITFERLSGSDRYQTAVEVYKEFQSLFTSDSVAIATGKAFPDALAGVALAARNGMPVFLVGNEASFALLKEVSAMDIDTLYVFGGINAVSQSVVTELTK